MMTFEVPAVAVVLAAFTVFYVASGAFVSLTQAELMEARPDRQAQDMARWDLAGSAVLGVAISRPS